MQGVQDFFSGMFQPGEGNGQQDGQQTGKDELQKENKAWLKQIGFGPGLTSAFGFSSQRKEEKTYTSCLKYPKFFEGKNVLVTGATGGIGAKVTKKLLKYGAKVVALVQDSSQLDQALRLKERRLTANLIPINLNLREPY